MAGKITNKKGMEMSINTIVILVIAVTMLILGLVLVRTIMCGAMNLASTTSDGAQAQLNKLFSEESGEEVVCMGVNSPLDIVPGKANIVGCAIKAPLEKTYTYTYTIKSAQDSEGKVIPNVNTWFRGFAGSTMTGTKPIGSGKTEKITFEIRVPDDAPEGDVLMTAVVTKDGKTIASKDLYLTIKRVGFVQNSVC